MPLSDLANIAQVIASAAVVVLLVFISMQLRQNSRISKAVMTAQTDQYFANLMAPLLDREFSELWFRRSMGGNGELDTPDFLRFWAYHRNMFHAQQDVYTQIKTGLLDKNAHWLQERSIQFVFPGSRAMWEIQKETFDPDFVKFQDELAASLPIVSKESGRRAKWHWIKESYIKAAS